MYSLRMVGRALAAIGTLAVLLGPGAPSLAQPPPPRASDGGPISVGGSATRPEEMVDPGGPLAWREINILHLTDVHSWISGHRHSEASVSTGYGGPWRRVATAAQDADYGDLLSLIERLKAEASRRGVALFVFNSGDVVDGTGLSNLTPVNGQNLTPLLQALPFDAVAVGNHELYESATVGNLVELGQGARR